MCEKCGITLTTKYGSGRFCSAQCARSFSTAKNRQDINLKVSNKLSGRPSPNPNWHLLVAQQKGAKANHEKKLNTLVRIGTDTLNITHRELLNYREQHQVCEICGREDVFLEHIGRRPNLSVDHCHKTGEFRGLLCRACNFRLGWYEAQKENISKYLGD